MRLRVRREARCEARCGEAAKMTVPVNSESRDIASRSWEPIDLEKGEAGADGRAGSRSESASPYALATAGEEGLLEWDVWLDVPARPERTLLARFEYVGRDRPLPVDDPEEESEPDA
jgi:hypothetical protein